MSDLELDCRDISTEAWREYDFGNRVYRITMPKKLYMRPGSTTHRVVDLYGVCHCVPAPGHFGCVLRWQGHDGGPDVSF